MGKRVIPPADRGIEVVELKEALEERYLAYALSTIMHRALPDARDGLKPVHRRILYGMRLLRLAPGSIFKKSAKIVGDVMGNFHPRGDQAIYDALVRLAQDFASRYPLVDGQGNFGNIDGDSAAAYRYTEARMSDVARLLLDGIDEDAVEFRANYDGQSQEPVVLPAAFPNLLANGAAGIAVGMATSIPPHNVAELLDAALHLIGKPRAKSRELLKFVRGPDFPTGGLIVDDKSTIADASVTEPRSRNVDPQILMESLFKLTELENRFPLNLNVLTGGKVPQVIGLAECLREWLDHRRDVLQRRSRFRLAEIKHRLEVLGGLLIAYLNLDAVIKIIRREDEPKPVLMKRFKLSEVQATAILDMRLRNLRKLEEMEIKREHKALGEEKKQVEKLLASPAQQWKAITAQIKEVREKYGPTTALGRRRTGFDKVQEIDIEAVSQAMIEKETITVAVSQKGWIRALKGQNADLSNLTFKGDDRLRLAFPAETTSKLMAFATNGRFYTMHAAQMPGVRGSGEPIRLFVDMEQEADLVDVFAFVGGRKFVVASHSGNGFIVREDDGVANTRRGKQVLNLNSPDEARAIALATGDTLAVIGENRKMVLFPLAELPEMGRGRGVRLQRYKDGGLSDIRAFDIDDGLSWTDSADRTTTLTKRDLSDWIGKRADAGRIAPKGFPKSNRFK